MSKERMYFNVSDLEAEFLEFVRLYARKKTKEM